MKNLGVIKGQPFRFGSFDPLGAPNKSTTINFLSDQNLEQTKSAPPISRVNAKDAFLSIDLALSRILFEIYSNPIQDIHSAGLWESIHPKANTLIFVSRQYLLAEIEPLLPSDMDSERKKLECRKLLASLESAWNTSIIQPDLIPALLCKHGWNAKTKTLYTMPYTPLPVGRIESIGSSSISKTESHETTDKKTEIESCELHKRRVSGLIYKSESYPNGCFNVDLTSSESALATSQEKTKIYLVYVDSLPSLQSDAVWPELLKRNTSPALREFAKTANLLVIDSAAKIHGYEKALECNLQASKKPFDVVLPCCTFRQQEFLTRLNVDTLISLKQTTTSAAVEKISLKESDLSAMTRAFHDLYPTYSPGDSLPLAVINRALNQFGYLAKDGPAELVLTGRGQDTSNPTGPSIFYMMCGLLRKLLENIIDEASGRLIFRRSDLDDKIYSRIRDEDNGSTSRIAWVSSQGDLSHNSGLDIVSTLDVLRDLLTKDTENPYKLIKHLDKNKLALMQHDSNYLFTIIILEDF